jgi:SAM-dependent methyltransferase
MGTSGKVHETKNLDLDKVQAFQMRVMQDLAAAIGVACANIGDRLNLFKVLSQSGPMTSHELAEKTSTHERYIREWLLNQAAGGYLEYDPASQKYSLPPEHAAVLADEYGPYFCGGGFEGFMAMIHSEPSIAKCFESGKGFGWAEHDPHLFSGTERFFRPSYTGQLISHWIPAIDGLQEKLEAGAKVADVGCGHGFSTLVMARAFPQSRFFGFDNHAPSIEHANAEAKRERVHQRATFAVFDATDFAGEEYDLVSFFDCLHDLGDPVGACRRARQALKSDGIAMIVEPMGADTVEGNFNVIGRAMSGASVLCCTPNSMASGGPALGTVASDRALEETVKAGGFKNFRRVTDTPFNRIFVAY